LSKPFLAFLKKEDFVRGNDLKIGKILGVDFFMTGWIGSKNAIVSGLPAFIAKEAIEAQYDLLLTGIDSYVV
jgi:hypothetical protein